MRITSAAWSAVAVLCCCYAVSPAFADARLVQSSPAAESAIAAPKSITLTFSEKLAPASSGVALSMSDGMTIPTKTSLSEDGTILTARPTSPFMSGKWTLSWRATSAADGHKSEGTYNFTIK